MTDKKDNDTLTEKELDKIFENAGKITQDSLKKGEIPFMTTNELKKIIMEQNKNHEKFLRQESRFKALFSASLQIYCALVNAHYITNSCKENNFNEELGSNTAIRHAKCLIKKIEGESKNVS